MKNLKNSVLLFLLALLLGGGSTISYEKLFSGAGGDHHYLLVGTPATSTEQPKLTKLPNVFVDSVDATTTVPYSYIGDATSTGGLVNQRVVVEGFTDFTLAAQLRGGTATSTFCVREYWSFDDVTYYNISLTQSASTTASSFSTSTPSITTQAVCNDPGTSTTTFSFTGSIPPGAKSARFAFYGEDVSTDPKDGVEGTISVYLEDKSGRQ